MSLTREEFLDIMYEEIEKYNAKKFGKENYLDDEYNKKNSYSCYNEDDDKKFMSDYDNFSVMEY